MLLTSNGRDRRKGIEKGSTILLTSNGGESRKGIEKGGAILLMSNVRGGTRETEADSCAYLLRSMGICYYNKYPFFHLWVFATVANTH